MKRILFTAVMLTSLGTMAQNVGINSTGAAPATSAALDVDMANKGVLIPRVALTTTAAFAPVTGAATTSLMVYNTATAGSGGTAVAPGFYYWDGSRWVKIAGGQTDWLVGTGTANVNYPGTTGYFGTSDNNHVDITTNGIVRGRFSNLGEFFLGTTTTALTGDLMNGVGNASFPFAVNGYTSFNGSAVYGLRQAAAAGVWGSIQGETDVSVAAGNSGVSGLASLNSHRGVTGQKPAGGSGFGGLFINDLGYSGGAYSLSDERLKVNIRPYSGALDKVRQLNFYTYKMDTENYEVLGDDKMHYGVMAQELESVFPTMVATKNIAQGESRIGNELKSPEFDVKMVNYTELIPVALQAIKEQQEIIEKLEKRVAELEEKLR